MLNLNKVHCQYLLMSIFAMIPMYGKTHDRVLYKYLQKII